MKYKVIVNNETFEVDVEQGNNEDLKVTIEGKTYQVNIEKLERVRSEDMVIPTVLKTISPQQATKKSGKVEFKEGNILAPMTGKIISIKVKLFSSNNQLIF